MSFIRLSDGSTYDFTDSCPLPPRRVITRSLSMMNRYTGHTLRPYSVAEHTVRLYWKVPAHLRRAALLHDFTEAFMADVAHPLKVLLPNYMEMEDILLARIFDHFEEDYQNFEELRPYDRRICVDEMTALFTCHTDHNLEPLGVTVPKTEVHWKTAHRWLDELCKIEGIRE